MKHSSFQREDHSLITSRTTAHQETIWGQIKGMQALHTSDLYQQPHPWTIAIKLLTKFPQVGTHSFWGHEPAVSPFAWQSNKAILFYFTQNSVSEVWFGTGVQRQSFWHHYHPSRSLGSEERIKGSGIIMRLKQILYLELRSFLRSTIYCSLESRSMVGCSLESRSVALKGTC